MIIYLVGSLNGDLNFLNQQWNSRPDWIICVGSLGVWPDPQRLDRATKKHGPKDFPTYYLNQTPLNYKTIFVEGVHEDHRWLTDRANRNQFEIIPNLTYLKNSNHTIIGDTEHKIKLLGLGKSYSPKTYNKTKSFSHYTETEIKQACSTGPVDILIAHEGLYNHKYGKFTCQAKGLQKIIYATRPKLFVHGHYNTFQRYSFQDTPCISLKDKQILAIEWNKDSFHIV